MTRPRAHTAAGLERPQSHSNGRCCYAHGGGWQSLLVMLLAWTTLCFSTRVAAFSSPPPPFYATTRIRSSLPRTTTTTTRTVSLHRAVHGIRARTFVTSTTLLKSWGGLVGGGGDEYAGLPRVLPNRSSSTSDHHGRQSHIVLFMGKGDGKKKRKKKSALSSNPEATTAASSPTTPAPRRVSTDINIPVRKQLLMAQFNKQAAKQASPSFRQQKVLRTKYRRTWDEEEVEIKAEERRRKGQDPDWDVILNRTASSPLVIVDGYNIIHKWPRLKKHMNKGDVQRARQLLVDDLESLRSLKGWRIECVFDGMGRSTVGPLGSGPGSRAAKPTAADRASKKSVSKYGVRVVFSGIGSEADAYIEARCAQAKNVTQGVLTSSLIVATDDAMIRMAGHSAGAHCMRADRFVDELKAVKKGISYRVEAAVAKANGHAIRPEKLRGTSIHRFGRGSVVIEDKRNRTKTKRQQLLPEEEYPLQLNLTVEEEENGIPWWAKLPNQTRPYV